MKRKVLSFIHGFSMGGAETLVKDYCLKIDKEKFDITVLCFHRYHTPYEEILKEAGINVIYLSDEIKNYDKISKKYPGRFWMLFQRIRLLRKYLRTLPYDVLHFHMFLSSYVLFLGTKRPLKLFRTIHVDVEDEWDSCMDSKLDLWATRQLVKKRGLQFIALHQNMQKDIDQLFGLNNTVVLNNGIDFKRFERALPKEKVRENLGISQEAFVVGHIGRFNEQKNHEKLVEVFSEIYRSNKNAFLLMIGNGSLQEDVEEQLEKLGLKDRYLILSNRGDIPALLQSMDCFVFPSRFEGLGIVLIEAQKMGLPCIISNMVPEAADVSNLIKRMDLAQSAKEWAEMAMNFKVDRVEYYDIDAWDMECVVRVLESYYSV